MIDEAVPPASGEDVSDETTAAASDGSEFLTVLGVALSTVGLGALVCAFGPFFYAYGDEPLWLASAALLLPLGAAVLGWPAMRAAGRPRPEDPAAAPTPPAS